MLSALPPPPPHPSPANPELFPPVIRDNMTIYMPDNLCPLNVFILVPLIYASYGWQGERQRERRRAGVLWPVFS